tara:strand:- start:781 stop:957 length:177 start_codon:yes stop_codon:yes gene_type:complete
MPVVKSSIEYRMQTLLASGMSYMVFEFRFGNSSISLKRRFFTRHPRKEISRVKDKNEK